MKNAEAVAALAALAQDSRLDVFRLLVEAGPDGMPAGRVAEKLKLAPSAMPAGSSSICVPPMANDFGSLLT